MTSTGNGTYRNIPHELRQRLMDIAGKLPQAVRGQFVRNAASRISSLIAEHPRTILYGAGGWVAGEFIDNLLTFTVPFTGGTLSPTGGVASEIGALVGGLYGFSVDRGKDSQKDMIRCIIREEYRGALAAAR